MSNWRDQIKPKMEERELPTSDMKWETLAKQLDEENQKSPVKTKKTLSIIGVGMAASILLIAVLGWWFASSNHANQSPLQENNNLNVKETKIEESQDKINFDMNESKPSFDIKENEPIMANVDESSQQEDKTESKINIEPTELPIIQESEPIESLAVQDEIPENVTELLSADELLDNALKNRSIKKENHIVIDHRKLLNQVENEIFEEKSPAVLEKLTNQLQNLQIALSERNQEK